LPGAKGGGVREPNPRVLVVGDAALEKRVRETLFEAEVSAAVASVPDFLLALGELAIGRVAAVVGRVAAMHDAPAATAGAMRRLAPSARLVLVARPEEEPDAARGVTAGFDDYVLDPISPDELMDALGGVDDAPVAVSAPDAPAEPAGVEPAPGGLRQHRHEPAPARG